MGSIRTMVLAAACGLMCVGVPALAFNPRNGPPTRGYYAGGKGNNMRARLVIQLPYTYHHQHIPAFDDGVTLHDCRGNHQFVYGGGAAEQIGYPHGTFSDSGRGAVIRHYNGQEPFLHHYKHFTASGTINGKTGSITYKIAGCKPRHYAIKAQ